MKWVNRGFGIVVLGFAVWYGRLAWQGFGGALEGKWPNVGSEVVEVTPATLSAGLRSVGSRPVLVDCWATWCKNCAAMESTTLADPAVRAKLEKFAIIRLQAEDIDELRKVPGFGRVMGLPAFAIFD